MTLFMCPPLISPRGVLCIMVEVSAALFDSIRWTNHKPKLIEPQILLLFKFTCLFSHIKWKLFLLFIAAPRASKTNQIIHWPPKRDWMGRSRKLGITRSFLPKKGFLYDHTINPILTKKARYANSICVVMGFFHALVHKHTQKTELSCSIFSYVDLTLGQWPIHIIAVKRLTEPLLGNKVVPITRGVNDTVRFHASK